MNRRKTNRRQRGKSGFLFPAPMALLLATAASLAFSYLWLDARVKVLGREIRHMERGLQEARKQRSQEEFLWESMRSPGRIETILRAHGLNLSRPDAGRVVQLYVSEPSSARVGDAHPRVARNE